MRGPPICEAKNVIHAWWLTWKSIENETWGSDKAKKKNQWEVGLCTKTWNDLQKGDRSGGSPRIKGGLNISDEDSFILLGSYGPRSNHIPPEPLAGTQLEYFSQGKMTHSKEKPKSCIMKPHCFYYLDSGVSPFSLGHWSLKDRDHILFQSIFLPLAWCLERRNVS